MVEMTDISSPLAVAWYLAPHDVQIASVSFGRVFDVCFHGKKVSQIQISHSDNIFDRTSRWSEVLFPPFLNKLSVRTGFKQVYRT